MTKPHQVRVICSDPSHAEPRRVAWFEVEPVPTELLALGSDTDTPRWWVTATSRGVNLLPATREQVESDIARANLYGASRPLRLRSSGYRLRCRCGIDLRVRAETLDAVLARCGDAGVSELSLPSLAAMFE